MCKAVMELEQRGREEGIAEGTINTLVSLVRDGLLDIAEAAKRAGISVEEMKAKIGKDR